MIKEVVFPTDSPNGIGLSPDGNTLYWAETHTGRVFHLAITAPGETAPFSPIDPSVCLCGLPGVQLFDSLAVDGDGNFEKMGNLLLKSHRLAKSLVHIACVNEP